jgi:hypothetical protein
MRTLFIAIVALIVMTSACAAGVYTTTYTMPDGRILTCTTITDINDNPILVNCI